MIEADVKKSLRQYLKQLGAYQFWPVPMGYGAKTVDCLFCYKGKFYAVECKRPGVNIFCYKGKFYAVERKRPGVNKATPFQAEVLFEIGEADGEWCVENDPALPAVRNMLGL